VCIEGWELSAELLRVWVTVALRGYTCFSFVDALSFYLSLLWNFWKFLYPEYLHCNCIKLIWLKLSNLKVCLILAGIIENELYCIAHQCFSVSYLFLLLAELVVLVLYPALHVQIQVCLSTEIVESRPVEFRRLQGSCQRLQDLVAPSTFLSVLYWNVDIDCNRFKYLDAHDLVTTRCRAFFSAFLFWVELLCEGFIMNNFEIIS